MEIDKEVLGEIARLRSEMKKTKSSPDFKALEKADQQGIIRFFLGQLEDIIKEEKRRISS